MTEPSYSFDATNRTEEELLIRLDKYHQDEIVNYIFHDILKVVTLLLEDVKLVVIVDYSKGLVTGSLTLYAVCQSWEFRFYGLAV